MKQCYPDRLTGNDRHTRKDYIMIKSLYSGVSGLKAHNSRMDAIGNNIANVNTTSYKANTVTFKDVFYQTKVNSSSGNSTQGGVNPQQVGYGVKLGTIGQVMTQSGLTYSDSVTDCALQGEGFFQVMDRSGNIFFTRNGVFNIDDVGNLVDSNGYIVLGVSGDPTGTGASQQRINISIPNVENSIASVNKTINGYGITISASGYGEEGNISLSIKHSESPFATYSNGSLQVSLNLKEDFVDQVLYETDPNAAIEGAKLKFQAAVNEAIKAGGIDIDGVTPLAIEFDGTPAEVNALKASNTMTFPNAAGTATYGLTYTASEAGEAGNSKEINMKSSSTIENVTAVWSGDVLTVTVPNATNPSTGALLHPFTLADIQNAINKAAEMKNNGATPPVWDNTTGNASKKITVTASSTTGTTTTPTTDISTWNLGSLVPTTEKRLGLSGGKDSFFSEMVSGIGMVKLDGGHTFAEQKHDDLDSLFIDSSGVIYGEHAVHGRLILGRIDLVTFENPAGLDRIGTSYWKASLASGDPTVKQAGELGAAEIVSSALEMSNVDLSQEFSDMIITQRGFQANSRVITVSDTMLEELVNLKR